MAVKIRLSRVGKKGVPFYRIVAVDGRKKRDGAFLEDLGTYDAVGNKMIVLREERVQDWISKGAVPTDAVMKLYKTYATSPVAPEAPKAPKKAKVAKAKPAKKASAQA